MELTRKQVIEILSNIDKAYRTFTREEIEALDYAISSLKTDEAYQIMFEGGEIFTKDDMVAMLEDLDLQIDESAAYNLEIAKVQRLIRDKINALKGEQGENTN